MEDQIQADFEMVGTFIDQAQMKLEIPLGQSTAIYNAAERLRQGAMLVVNLKGEVENAKKAAEEKQAEYEELELENKKLFARVADLEDQLENGVKLPPPKKKPVKPTNPKE